MNNSFEYIKKCYNVPAEIGRVVKVKGKQGVIVKDMGNYIGVNFDGDKPSLISPCHPTWEVEYLGMSRPRKVSKSAQRYLKWLTVGREIGLDHFIDFCQWDDMRIKLRKQSEG